MDGNPYHGGYGPPPGYQQQPFYNHGMNPQEQYPHYGPPQGGYYPGEGQNFSGHRGQYHQPRGRGGYNNRGGRGGYNRGDRGRDGGRRGGAPYHRGRPPHANNRGDDRGSYDNQHGGGDTGNPYFKLSFLEDPWKHLAPKQSPLSKSGDVEAQAPVAHPNSDDYFEADYSDDENADEKPADAMNLSDDEEEALVVQQSNTSVEEARAGTRIGNIQSSSSSSAQNETRVDQLAAKKASLLSMLPPPKHT